ncbi:hypothetical protein A3D14_03160 [Candidatus Saccharibacteria bacterium RIFCSPHIGHO2_02_FULL_47_12]|nr:MAG: hypothetical protein A3D14_03160 [Candidatus Saccharibacteria bacterium RIFCSPHIGHO2_02_FULL_47_12]
MIAITEVKSKPKSLKQRAYHKSTAVFDKSYTCEYANAQKTKIKMLKLWPGNAPPWLQIL